VPTSTESTRHCQHQKKKGRRGNTPLPAVRARAFGTFYDPNLKLGQQHLELVKTKTFDTVQNQKEKEKGNHNNEACMGCRANAP
jgi:hypothetical protein